MDNIYLVLCLGLLCLGFLIFIIIFIVLIFLSKKTRKKYKNSIDYELKKHNITISRRINLLDRYSFIIDMPGKRVVCCNFHDGSYKKINFSDLVRCEIVQDQEVVRTGSSLNTAVGGVLGGAAGAIIMESFRKNKTKVSKLNVVIITKDITAPAYTFKLVSRGTVTASETYRNYMKFAEEVFMVIESIIANSR